MDNKPLISTGNLTRQSMAGVVAVVTGAGGGIGYEAARALAWLGAKVIIAEINQSSGKKAASQISTEMGNGSAVFIFTDIGDERSVNHLAKKALQEFGKVDVVVNNATIAPLGAVVDRSIRDWDDSYRVNLRGPVLLAKAFIPGMVQRNIGVFVCVSSVGGGYMGAYETFKTAQVELARTLDAELEGTGVVTFTIGPGIVPTSTAVTGVQKIAPLYGKTPDEFFAMYKDFFISAEAAGAGFAAAVAQAGRFRGMEIWSKAALVAIGIELPDETSKPAARSITGAEAGAALELCKKVNDTLQKEYDGWKQRSLFERGWMLRDFKQNAGMSIEETLKNLSVLKNALENHDQVGINRSFSIVKQVAKYYQHYGALAQSSVKDPVNAQEFTQIIQGWQDDCEALAKMLA